MVEETFQEVAGFVALGIEAIVVLLLAYAALEAVVGTVKAIATRGMGQGVRREVWFRFALWIVLALEFALAADIIRTAIAPSWDSIGMLAAIAAVRTFLNYFLVKDIESYSEKRGEGRSGLEGR
ncbi:DUF1622 domain-containing protein [Sandaracinobacter sp. RS1-74]|uniref:DUF1622 domain-containing protein n=1 Tax=Sandaracinobacteroides sayramensis TaxID=2913411 RepID=UPI001EDAC1AF|nr:DUF1622 domain-containing protein [Sandaracinobacteroides sayramensis]MCG2841083.1 DUF1622 domain-containing protein [Sandaracinobacteroides sayramensis]